MSPKVKVVSASLCDFLLHYESERHDIISVTIFLIKVAIGPDELLVRSELSIGFI